MGEVFTDYGKADIHVIKNRMLTLLFKYLFNLLNIVGINIQINPRILKIGARCLNDVPFVFYWLSGSVISINDPWLKLIFHLYTNDK